jgi:DNA-binding phage protein
MKPYNPVLFIKIDKDIADYLNRAYLEGGPVVFLITLDDVAKTKVVSKVAKQSGLNRVNFA